MNLPGTHYRLRIESRSHLPAWIGVVSAILGVFLALVVGGFVLRAGGRDRSDRHVH